MFGFSAGCIDAMTISIEEFPGQVQMRQEMVENLLKPALACNFFGADLFLVIDAVLLDLDPMMTEAAS